LKSWVIKKAMRMRLSAEMKDFVTYSNIPGGIPTVVKVCQKGDNQITQWQAENAAQNIRGWIEFDSFRLHPASEAPTTAPAGTVAGYTGPAPMDHSAAKRRISAEKRARGSWMGGVYTGVG
jgi:hypothetical protein